ncbi:LOW QUALITY PROTEIN: MAM and LDL-receptor class A domain-containing protein 1-like [Uloborus diversus]|uniref:LOW QUALITY PROTEIN: MAM and LDL-receptor class A domain-containing protein 1-like n=1 Tax=Uloborus diversus TaxID=327109 RepID=UPI0024095F43|nr:LOW QUALITY PROTEIN: MAM and LDL-receptor class A domain-containing protein 1-like [Uloborus diversus]
MSVLSLLLIILIFSTLSTTTETENNKNPISRYRRDDEPEKVPQSCDFGSVGRLTTCDWTVPENITEDAVRWRPGMGSSSNWIGGPSIDHTGSDENSGYIFYESSSLGSDRDLPDSSSLLGPVLQQTSPSGLCLSFFYSMAGLSIRSLRVLLRSLRRGGRDALLWDSRDSPAADTSWNPGEVVYSYGDPHQIVFEAVPDLQTHTYRGHIALDDIRFQPVPSRESCVGHCTFEGGFCDWDNLEEDDFDWELGRGSTSFLTGPARDHASDGRDEQTGGFAHIGTSYPRRPGDTAMLRSPGFPPTGDNAPLCCRFATHMHGHGVGTLRLVLKNEDESDKTVWEMSGPSGSSWHRARVTLSSLSPFRLLFIAIVGNQFGTIAIDDVSFRPGPCPVVPQTAAKDVGDCSFEDNMCSWNNPSPQDNLDDIDWARQYSYDPSGPPSDHTRGDSKGYFMNLLSARAPKPQSGSKAWLVSSRFRPSAVPRCVSFHYWMQERLIDPQGLSLGSLRVFVRLMLPGKPLIPVWRLHNHQGERWFPARAPIRAQSDSDFEVVFEGTWGEGRSGTIALDDVVFFDGDCTTEPLGAAAVSGECFFEEGTCGWIALPDPKEDDPSSTTTEPKENPISRWKLAKSDNKPAGLSDHTFHSPTGYVFFDVFHAHEPLRPILRSPLLELSTGGVRCLGFWFVAFGRSEATALEVVLLDLSDPELPKRTVIWRLEARNFANASRTEWSYAQVSVESRGDFLLQFEGHSSDGGFAVDDLSFYDGTCHARPPAAVGKG